MSGNLRGVLTFFFVVDLAVMKQKINDYNKAPLVCIGSYAMAFGSHEN